MRGLGTSGGGEMMDKVIGSSGEGITSLVRDIKENLGDSENYEVHPSGIHSFNDCLELSSISSTGSSSTNAVHATYNKMLEDFK
jgi:hypothetical protein